jgi:hypothetical protein
MVGERRKDNNRPKHLLSRVLPERGRYRRRRRSRRTRGTYGLFGRVLLLVRGFLDRGKRAGLFFVESAVVASGFFLDVGSCTNTRSQDSRMHQQVMETRPRRG